MLRYILVLVFLFVVNSANAIKCHLQTIETDYNRSDLVFYGEFINSKESDSLFHFFGGEFIIDNFVIYKVFKGFRESKSPDLNRLDGDNQLSLINYKYDYYFKQYEPGKYYLIYAYRDPVFGFLTTNPCFRNREILNDNFTVTYGKDELGKDELKELLQLRKKDIITKRRNITEEFEYNQSQLLEQIEKKSELAEKYKNALIFTSIVAFILAISVIYLKTKRPG